MARKPAMSGFCSHPSKTDGVDSHERCLKGNAANPGKEWQPCPCICHLGEEYLCSNCGRPIFEAPHWRDFEDDEDMVYVHVDAKTGRAYGEECPPGGKPLALVEEVSEGSDTVEVVVEEEPTKKKKKKKKDKKKKKKKRKLDEAA